ncbi:head-tail adaptor protein, partial [Parasphingorhabdus sp.]
TPLGTVWAKMIQQLPSEVFASGSDQTAESVIFQVRNGLSIAENMVVVYNSKRYEINGIQEAGRNDRSNLICSRVGDSI